MRQTVVMLVVSGLLASEGIAFQAQPGPGGACSLLSKELALKVSGAANKRIFDMPPREEKLKTGSSCSYGDINLQIDVFSPKSIEGMRKSAEKEWAPLAGVADSAYFQDNKSRFAEVMGYVGTRTFTIQMGVPFSGTAEAMKPNAITLAKAIAEKLR